jgi:hypothetical protein
MLSVFAIANFRKIPVDIRKHRGVVLAHQHGRHDMDFIIYAGILFGGFAGLVVAVAFFNGAF